MPTPNEIHNSNSVPHGGISVNMYRTQATPALLGVYVVEQATPTDNAVLIERPASDGGDGGWALVGGITEGPATIQMAASATPTILNGDFFVSSVFKNNASGTAVQRWWVVLNPSLTVAGGDYRKFSCTLREDKFPTAAMQAISEL